MVVLASHQGTLLVTPEGPAKARLIPGRHESWHPIDGPKRLHAQMILKVILSENSACALKSKAFFFFFGRKSKRYPDAMPPAQSGLEPP